jgi:phenylacetate-CoA ligase
MLASHDKALHDRAIQTLSAESLVVLAERSVAAVMERLAGTVYAERRRRATDELAALPVMSGEELAAEVIEHPPFGRLRIENDDLIRAGLATAAVPQPTPTAWSRSDLDEEAVLGARALWRAGLRPRGRSSDCLDGGLVTPGTLAVTDALDTLDALALPVGPLTSEAALHRAAQVWEIVRPQILIADAASQAFLRRSGAPCDLPLLVLLTPEDAALLGAPPEAGVCRVLSLPQACTFLAGECSRRDGFHVAEDAIAVEILDPQSSRPLPDGASGRLVVSTLKRTLAVLRLDTGLTASVDRSPCACGETHARLSFA